MLALCHFRDVSGHFEAADAGASADAGAAEGAAITGVDAAGATTAAGLAWVDAGAATLAPTGNSGTISSATMLMILISGFTAGPAVSL